MWCEKTRKRLGSEGALWMASLSCRGASEPVDEMSRWSAKLSAEGLCESLRRGGRCQSRTAGGGASARVRAARPPRLSPILRMVKVAVSFRGWQLGWHVLHYGAILKPRHTFSELDQPHDRYERAPTRGRPKVTVCWGV